MLSIQIDTLNVALFLDDGGARLMKFAVRVICRMRRLEEKRKRDRDTGK